MRAIRMQHFMSDGVRIYTKPDTDPQHYPYIDMRFDSEGKFLDMNFVHFPIDYTSNEAIELYHALEMAIRIAQGESVEEVNKAWIRELK